MWLSVIAEGGCERERERQRTGRAVAKPPQKPSLNGSDEDMARRTRSTERSDICGNGIVHSKRIEKAWREL
jgi:hypothetical protein